MLKLLLAAVIALPLAGCFSVGAGPVDVTIGRQRPVYYPEPRPYWGGWGHEHWGHDRWHRHRGW